MGRETSASRVLWVHGASSAGKSTAVWQLYESLAAAGEPVAYVDIDQLGMCYPAPSDDPGRHRLKSRVLADLLPHYARAGARTVLVSGVVDPSGDDGLRARLAPSSLTLLRLAVAEQTLEARTRERGGDEDEVQQVLAENRALDALPIGDGSIRGDDRTPRQVAAELRDRWYTPFAPDRAAVRPTAAASSSSTGIVVAVCGVTGTGTSDVAWNVFSALRRQGRTCAFLDLEQLGFVAGERSTRLQVVNVAAAWNTFAAVGASHLVLNSHLASDEEARLLRTALPGADVHVVRLRADRETLTDRVVARAGGERARLAGDRIVGLPPEQIARAVEEAWEEQLRADDADFADETLDTSGLAAGDVAVLLACSTAAPATG